jgi:hypothetical protein
MASLVLPLVAATAVVACSESITPGLHPVILELSVDGLDQPHARTLHLRLAREAAVYVEYWTPGADRLGVSSPPGTEHTILVPRLRAGSVYDYQVRTRDGNGRHTDPLHGRLTTSALPPDLADIRLTSTGAPSRPLILLVVNNAGTGGFAGILAVDGDGEVVWHARVDGPSGITRRGNGNFVLVSSRGLVEVTPLGDVVAEALTDPEARRFHHDVVATPDHTLLAIATDTQTVGGTRFTGEAIWEWTPETGDLQRRWSAFDDLDPYVDRGPRYSDDNWLHANSLWLGDRGNVLLSSNYLNQILSIAPDFSGVEWRLGGPNATIAVPDDERFSGQHTAAQVENGNVLLFDNRREQGGYSRTVEFELGGTQARKAWEWRPARDNFASIISSARRLPDGGTLVAFGTSEGLVGSSGPVEVYEVSPTGEVRWHLSVGGVFALYRAEPLDHLAGEVAVAAP